MSGRGDQLLPIDHGSNLPSGSDARTSVSHYQELHQGNAEAILAQPAQLYHQVHRCQWGTNDRIRGRSSRQLDFFCRVVSYILLMMLSDGVYGCLQLVRYRNVGTTRKKTLASLLMARYALPTPRRVLIIRTRLTAIYVMRWMLSSFEYVSTLA
jgi:hypothetical protein